MEFMWNWALPIALIAIVLWSAFRSPAGSARRAAEIGVAFAIGLYLVVVLLPSNAFWLKVLLVPIALAVVFISHRASRDLRAARKNKSQAV